MEKLEIGKRAEIIRKIDLLIRKKAAGTPEQLAARIRLSIGYTKQLIGVMRHTYGADITCKRGIGYVYNQDTEFFVGYLQRKKDGSREPVKQ